MNYDDIIKMKNNFNYGLEYNEDNKFKEHNVRLSDHILVNIHHYDQFFGHVAFILSLNLKKIIYIGKSKALPNYGNNYGLCSIHAEIDALKNLKNDNDYYNLLVFRWNRNKQLAMSKPCLNCLKIIKKNKINKVLYSINDGIIITNIENLNLNDAVPSSGFKFNNKCHSC